MEIPKSIQSTWKSISSDGSVNKKELDEVKKALMGDEVLRTDELEAPEQDFIFSLESAIVNSKSGSVEVKNLSFVDD